MISFSESSQNRNWIFEKTESINNLKENGMNIAFQKICQDSESRNLSMLTLGEEHSLQVNYIHLMFSLGVKMKIPFDVMETAVTYFRRFIISHSFVEIDFIHFILTCIFLACKSEERFLNIGNLFKITKESLKTLQKPLENDIIVDYELELLKSIRFDLVVFKLCNALEGQILQLNQLIKRSLDRNQYTEYFNNDLSAFLNEKFNQRKEGLNLIKDIYISSTVLFKYNPSVVSLAVIYSILGRNQKQETFEKWIEIEHGEQRANKAVLPLIEKIIKEIIRERGKKNSVKKTVTVAKSKLGPLRASFEKWKVLEKQRKFEEENEKRRKEFFEITENMENEEEEEENDNFSD